MVSTILSTAYTPSHLITTVASPFTNEQMRVREYMRPGPSRKKMATEGFLEEFNKGTLYREEGRVKETYRGWWGTPRLATVGSSYQL